MGNIGFGELLIILCVVLLVFGAARIPEIAKSLGKAVREFKAAKDDILDDKKDDAKKDDLKK